MACHNQRCWGKSSEAVTSRQATAEVLALKMFQKNLLMY